MPTPRRTARASDPAPPDGRRPPRKRRAEVLEAAGELFLEKGYEATSTAEIAARLGILRGSVYYYMDTKEGLLFELLENAADGFLRAVDAVRRSDVDALTKLARIVEEHVHYIAANRVATTLFLIEARSLSPEHQAIVAERTEEYRNAITEFVHEGQRTNAIRDDVRPEWATMLLLGAANWTHRWLGRTPSDAVDEIARDFAAMIVDGLRPRT